MAPSCCPSLSQPCTASPEPLPPLPGLGHQRLHQLPHPDLHQAPAALILACWGTWGSCRLTYWVGPKSSLTMLEGLSPFPLLPVPLCSACVTPEGQGSPLPVPWPPAFSCPSEHLVPLLLLAVSSAQHPIPHPSVPCSFLLQLVTPPPALWLLT
jgi:hypothetical protein